MQMHAFVLFDCSSTRSPIHPNTTAYTRLPHPHTCNRISNFKAYPLPLSHFNDANYKHLFSFLLQFAVLQLHVFSPPAPAHIRQNSRIACNNTVLFWFGEPCAVLRLMLFAFFPYSSTRLAVRRLRIHYFIFIQCSMQHFRGWLQVNRSSLSFFSSFFSSFFCFSFLSFSLSISGSPLDLFFPSLVLCVAYSFPFFIIMFLRYQTNTVGFVTQPEIEREREWTQWSPTNLW